MTNHMLVGTYENDLSAKGNFTYLYYTPDYDQNHSMLKGQDSNITMTSSMSWLQQYKYQYQWTPINKDHFLAYVQLAEGPPPQWSAKSGMSRHMSIAIGKQRISIDLDELSTAIYFPSPTDMY